ncbi:hypothetical protein ACFYYR_16630 [Streptomyces sp. NPDC001922]|uniref:hypothetical protein n=1 Tax=Streptomyces sp. NPDC001922 TaxID=3364624 RepID=UPI0036A91C1F
MAYAFQAPAADEGGEGVLLLPEEAVQVAEGDVVRLGDGRQREFRIAEVVLDEGADP